MDGLIDMKQHLLKLYYRDQTGSNGANLSFPDALGIPTKDNPNAARNQWYQGLINAGPYIASAFFGCWCSDPLNNLFGRRGCIFVSAIFCALSPIGSAVAQSEYILDLVYNYGAADRH